MLRSFIIYTLDLLLRLSYQGNESGEERSAYKILGRKLEDKTPHGKTEKIYIISSTV